ncbi:ABC transporter ATP-binding protein [Rhodoferax aquaticus]|uniref:ABC transporter ATP-binding protein n=1 Tax=Rhodoferax aquaticus TaxID=2527691 RepID=A0A515EQA2_9BURK|nr:ABC transporter ATP-binding protein [Rhodoferax aquaticus]QDL54785.1 ABC transporter ATP-binding protein [Rhodoferax aquaticus]
MANISVQALDIELGGVSIIKHLNLEVQAGEFLVLLGPSGCGKSTLLHSIAGLIDVTDGSISIGGNDVTWADPKDRGIGMVFQSYALYPTMTVEGNMAFGPRLAGVAKAEIAKRVEQAAAMLHLTELLQRKPANLSGGQRQRVAIGRALVRQANVFLFDEPLSNLDAKLRAELRRELKELHNKLGVTMVYVTHDQVEAMTLASRIAVMRSGKIQQIDTPAAVYGKPANMYVAGFLGSPSMNFLEGTLEVSGAEAAFVSPALRLPLTGYAFKTPPRNGQKVVLGVRPEDVSGHSVAAPDHAAATVRLVEPMGPNQVVWLQVGDTQLGMTADCTVEYSKGELTFVRVNASKASVFDAASQDRL